MSATWFDFVCDDASCSATRHEKRIATLFFHTEQMWTGELEHRYCLGSIPLKLLTFRHPDKLKGVESEWKKTPKKPNGSRWMDSISTNFETTRMGEICHWWWDQNLSPRIMNTSLTHPQDYPKLYNIYSPWKKNLPKRKTIIFEHHAIFVGGVFGDLSFREGVAYLGKDSALGEAQRCPGGYV